MRKRVFTSIAAVAVAASGILGGTLLTAESDSVDAQSTREKADSIMNLSYNGFADDSRVEPFNWTKDGCSVPVKFTPYRNVFRQACNQHDFGYRNYGKGKYSTLKLSPTAKTKDWIDKRFLAEMRRTCADQDRGATCRGAANAYHYVVQNHKSAKTAFYG